jgi:23S rRNA A1618 N6-methylase RlmF
LLNRALLEQDFGLKVNLPNGHLCPTVPNRTSYIKLLEVVFSNILQLSGSFLGVDMSGCRHVRIMNVAVINSLIFVVEPVPVVFIL